MARKKIIAGNWKMNKTPSEAVALVVKTVGSERGSGRGVLRAGD